MLVAWQGRKLCRLPLLPVPESWRTPEDRSSRSLCPMPLRSDASHHQGSLCHGRAISSIKLLTIFKIQGQLEALSISKKRKAKSNLSAVKSPLPTCPPRRCPNDPGDTTHHPRETWLARDPQHSHMGAILGAIIEPLDSCASGHSCGPIPFRSASPAAGSAELMFAQTRLGTRLLPVPHQLQQPAITRCS